MARRRRRKSFNRLGENADLMSMLDLVWRRKYVLLIPIILCTVAGYVVGMPKVLKPVYQCTSTLMLEFPQTISGELSKYVPASSMADQLARLQNQIQGERFLKKVIVATGMDKDPFVRQWAKENRHRYPDLSEEELVDLRLMKVLREAIRMVSPRANVFQINVQDQIPERARLIASTLTRAVIEANESSQLDQLRATHEFSLEQLALYKRKLDDSQDRLERERKKVVRRQSRPRLVDGTNRDQAWGLLENAKAETDRLSTEYEASTDSLAAVKPRLQVILLTLEDASWMEAATTDQQSKEKRYIELTLRPVATGEDAQSMAIQQARGLETLRSRSAETLVSGYPDLERRDREVITHALVLKVRHDVSSYAVDFLEQSLETDQSRLASSPGGDLSTRRLEEEVATNLALYNAFVQQIAVAEISEAFESTKVGGRITVLEPPQRPLSPVRPNRRALLLLGIVVGIAAGLAAVFFLEQHDPSLRDIGQIEELTGVKVLGTLPSMRELQQILKKSENGRVVTADRGKLREFFLGDHQAYHECRKVYLDLTRDSSKPARTILITSARAGEGKTTTAALLAVTMARENPGAKVIIVDLDTRRPSLHRLFGYSRSTPGVLQVLDGKRQLDDMLMTVWPKNLRVLPMGSATGSHGAILSPEVVRSFIHDLKERADYVIVDSPPNLPIPDALVAGGEVDAVLLVVRAGATPKRLVMRGVETQSQFSENVRGIIVNNAAGALPYYDSYRYYGYGT